MCGRFVLSDASWAEYHAALSITRPIERPVNYNIKVTNDVAIEFLQDGERLAEPARWWFVPHWFQNPVKEWKHKTFNAQIETAHEKPTFRTAWKLNRCLIPASGYFEWTGDKGAKQPHYITTDRNAPVMFFAGLRSVLPDGTSTCTILTRDALPEIADIHHRMPVILNDDECGQWLTQGAEDTHVIANFGLSMENRFLTHKVNKIGMKDDGPELIEPIDQAGFEF